MKTFSRFLLAGSLLFAFTSALAQVTLLFKSADPRQSKEHPHSVTVKYEYDCPPYVGLCKLGNQTFLEDVKTPLNVEPIYYLYADGIVRENIPYEMALSNTNQCEIRGLDFKKNWVFEFSYDEKLKQMRCFRIPE